MFYGFSILQLCAPRSPVCFSQLHVSKAKITASKNSPAAGDAACFDPTIPGLGSPFPVAKLELPDNLRVEPHTGSRLRSRLGDWSAGLCAKGQQLCQASSLPVGDPEQLGCKIGGWEPGKGFLPCPHSWTFGLYIPSELHPALYMGLPTLCFRSQQATPPTLKELGFEYRGINGSR